MVSGKSPMPPITAMANVEHSSLFAQYPRSQFALGIGKDVRAESVGQNGLGVSLYPMPCRFDTLLDDIH